MMSVKEIIGWAIKHPKKIIGGLIIIATLGGIYVGLGVTVGFVETTVLVGIALGLAVLLNIGTKMVCDD